MMSDHPIALLTTYDEYYLSSIAVSLATCSVTVMNDEPCWKDDADTIYRCGYFLRSSMFINGEVDQSSLFPPLMSGLSLYLWSERLFRSECINGDAHIDALARSLHSLLTVLTKSHHVERTPVQHSALDGDGFEDVWCRWEMLFRHAAACGQNISLLKTVTGFLFCSRFLFFASSSACVFYSFDSILFFYCLTGVSFRSDPDRTFRSPGRRFTHLAISEMETTSCCCRRVRRFLLTRRRRGSLRLLGCVTPSKVAASGTIRSPSRHSTSTCEST